MGVTKSAYPPTAEIKFAMSALSEFVRASLFAGPIERKIRGPFEPRKVCELIGWLLSRWGNFTNAVSQAGETATSIYVGVIMKMRLTLTVLAVVLLSCSTAKAEADYRPVQKLLDFSGLAWLGGDRFLIVHDAKNPDELNRDRVSLLKTPVSVSTPSNSPSLSVS